MLEPSPGISFPFPLVVSIAAIIFFSLGVVLFSVSRTTAPSRLFRYSAYSFAIKAVNFAYLALVQKQLLPWSELIWDLGSVLPVVLILMTAYDPAGMRTRNSDGWLFCGGYALFSLLLHFIFFDTSLKAASGTMAFILYLSSSVAIWRWFSEDGPRKINERSLAVLLGFLALHQLVYLWLAGIPRYVAVGVALHICFSLAYGVLLLMRAVLNLREKEDFESHYHKEIYQTVPVGLMVFNRFSRKVESINDTGMHILGYTLAELNQMQLPDDLIYPEDIPRWQKLRQDNDAAMVNLRIKSKKGILRMQVVRKVLAGLDYGHSVEKIIIGFHDNTRIMDLHEKLRQLEKILLHSPFVAFRCSGHRPWSVEFVSENVGFIGWEVDDFIKRHTPLSAIIHPDYLSDFASLVSRSFARNDTSFRIELRGLTSRGSERWFEIIGYPYKGNEFEKQRFECIVSDTTLKKRQSFRLEQREVLLSSIFDNAAFGIVMVNVDDGQIEMANSRFREMVGVYSGQIRGQLLVRYLPERGDEILRTLRTLSSGEPGYQTRMSLNIRHAAGNEFWGMAYISRLPDTNPDRRLAVLLLEDITLQKRVSDELAETFHRMPSALLIFDKDPLGNLRLNDINQAGIDLFRLHPYESFGKNIREISFRGSEKFHEILQKLFESLTETIPEVKSEISLIDDDQKVSLSLVAFLKKNGRIGLLAEDITDTRSLQKDLLVVADKERMQIGQNLHDGIGQQMAGVAMFMNSLLNKVRKGGHFDEYGHDVQNLINLINETNQKMRTFSRGLAPLAIPGSLLNEIISQSLIDVERLLSVKTHFQNRAGDIHFQAEPANHLFHILQEFSTNSVKHGKAKNIYCELFFENGRLTMRLQDDGLGQKAAKTVGLGVRTMQYRATQIGASMGLEFTGKGALLLLKFSEELEIDRRENYE